MRREISQKLPTFKGSSRLSMVIAVGLALVTGVLIFAALEGTGSSSSPSTSSSAAGGAVPVVMVVTASQGIPAGTEITPEMLALTAVPADSVLSGAFQEADAARAVGLFTRIPIGAGEQIVVAKVSDAGATGTGLKFIVPEGKRAIAISASKVISAGGLLRPGDRVDVLGTFPGLTVDGGPGDTVFPVAQNIEVLAVEQSLQNVVATGTTRPADSDADGVLIDQPEVVAAPSVVTLAVTPVESLLLLMAEKNGSIRLTVRAPGDADLITIAPAELVAQLQARAGLPAGEVTSVTLNAVEALLPLNEQTSISYVVPEGQRAIAIGVSKVIGAGGLVRPGDRVDILVVLDVEVIGDGESVTFSRAFTLSQAVEVLAVEQSLEALSGDGATTAEGARGTTAGDGELQPPAQPDAQVVTLALDPQVAQHVLLAELQGQIRLSVRAPGDTEIVELDDTAFFSIADSTNPFDLISSSVQILGEDR